jgi:hypothetical protein
VLAVKHRREGLPLTRWLVGTQERRGRRVQGARSGRAHRNSADP